MHKKYITIGIALLFLVPIGARAQSVSESSLESLLQQIKILQAQVAELQKKQGLSVQVARILSHDLRQGASNDETKALQEFLASDDSVYPEGMVTGFYGPLTARAVARFQAKHGLESEDAVGPKTRAKINELADDRDFKCRAWGHLIAPGQMKKLGKAVIDLSLCSKIPKGIEEKVDDDWKKATSTAATSSDTVAPRISSVRVGDISTTTAAISWKTNEKTASVVWYDASSTLDLATAHRQATSTFSLRHAMNLSELENNANYAFRIVVTDEAGNTATSSVSRFRTRSE